MEEIQRLRASRRGYKGHLTKLFNKAEGIVVNQGNLSELDIATATATIEQLKRKGEILRDLGERIQAQIDKEEDLETEILEDEEIQEEIGEKITKLSVLINTTHINSDSSNTSSNC